MLNCIDTASYTSGELKQLGRTWLMGLYSVSILSCKCTIVYSVTVQHEKCRSESVSTHRAVAFLRLFDFLRSNILGSASILCPAQAHTNPDILMSMDRAPFVHVTSLATPDIQYGSFLPFGQSKATLLICTALTQLLNFRSLNFRRLTTRDNRACTSESDSFVAGYAGPQEDTDELQADKRTSEIG
jgi:hypothetical protein